MRLRFSLSRALVIPLAFAVNASCAPALEAYEPLVCDASRTDHVAFVFQETEPFHGGYAPHGWRLLLIDGSCRFHAYTHLEAPGGVLRSGTLTDDELDALNAELLTAAWPSLDGQEVSAYEAVADAPFLVLRRDGLETRCNAACPDGSSQQLLVASAGTWLTRLWARGAPVDGPVELVGETVSEAFEPTAEWTGAPLGPRIAATLPGTRIHDPSEAAMLRALRDEHPTRNSFGPPLVVQEGDARLGVGVADALPLDATLRRQRAGQPWSW